MQARARRQSAFDCVRVRASVHASVRARMCVCVHGRACACACVRVRVYRCASACACACAQGLVGDVRAARLVDEARLAIDSRLAALEGAPAARRTGQAA
eukprot:6196198-Pleurochrysis_carterae.AAC.1